MTQEVQGRGEQIANQLRDDIINGLLPPGKALVETELAALYQTSRNTLREALHQLDREGLTQHQRNRGVFVRRLGAEQVRDIYRVRRVVEMQAIGASEHFNTVQLQAMRSPVEVAQIALERENWQQVGSSSLQFHRNLVATLDSALLNQFFVSVLAQLRLVFALDPSEERFQKPWVARDLQILELLETGQHQLARQSLSVYLEDSERSLLDLLHASR
jgi:DNA-binding GntR family transcriptional regulator